MSKIVKNTLYTVSCQSLFFLLAEQKFYSTPFLIRTDFSIKYLIQRKKLHQILKFEDKQKKTEHFPDVFSCAKYSLSFPEDAGNEVLN